MKKATKIVLMVSGGLFIGLVGVVGLFLLIGWLMSPAIDTSEPYDAEKVDAINQEVNEQFDAILEDSEGSETMPTNGVTLEQFNSIGTGQTYEEVVAILGSEGTLLSETDIAGIKSAMYQWDGTGIGNMNVTFSDGGVVSKAQFGLE